MNGDQDRGVIAENILALRRVRQTVFPRELFDEHAWTMLLLLFVSLAANEVVGGAILIERSDVTQGGAGSITSSRMDRSVPVRMVTM